MRPEYSSLAIVRSGDLIFFRSRSEGDAETLHDVVHQTVMYYQDRLSGAGFTRVMAGGTTRTAGEADEIRRDLESRLGRVLEPLDPARAGVAMDAAGTAAGPRAALAPLAGMLRRTRSEGALA
jgi:hypothetical protein